MTPVVAMSCIAEAFRRMVRDNPEGIPPTLVRDLAAERDLDQRRQN